MNARLRLVPTEPRYYNREGQRLSAEQWLQLYDKPGYNHIRSTRVGDYKVSTLWLGIDQNILHAGPPVIFVTSLLVKPDALTPHWTRLEAYTTMYSLEENARSGHEAVLKLVCNQLRNFDTKEVEGNEE